MASASKARVSSGSFRRWSDRRLQETFNGSIRQTAHFRIFALILLLVLLHYGVIHLHFAFLDFVYIFIDGTSGDQFYDGHRLRLANSMTGCNENKVLVRVLTKRTKNGTGRKMSNSPAIFCLAIIKRIEVEIV